MVSQRRSTPTLFVTLISLSALASGAEIRVVPQFGWGRYGRIGPDRRWAVWWSASTASVRVIDLQRRCLAWTICLQRPQDAAFSPSGSLLGVCGEWRGFVLDLRSGKWTYLPTLRGNRLAFSADGKSLFVVRVRRSAASTSADYGKAGDASSPEAGAELIWADQSGTVLRKYSLRMRHPSVVEVAPDGSKVTVAGVYYEADVKGTREGKRAGTIEEVVDLQSGSVSVNKGPLGKDWPKNYKSRRFDELNPSSTSRTIVQACHAFRFDPNSGILVAFGHNAPQGKMTPEEVRVPSRRGSALVAWHLPTGRFLGNLRRLYALRRVYDVYGFLRPGLLACLASKKAGVGVSLIDLSNKRNWFIRLEGSRSNDLFRLLPTDVVPNADGTRFAVFVPDARRLFTGSLQIWTLREELKLLAEVRSPFHVSMQWSPEGRLFRLREERDDKRVLEIRSQDGRLQKNLRAGDFMELAMTANAGALRTSAPRTPSEATDSVRQSLQASRKQESFARVECFAVSRSGKKLALGLRAGKTGRVVVVDTGTWKQVAELNDIPSVVSACQFAGDGLLLVAHGLGQVKLWNYLTGATIWSSNTGSDNIVAFGYVPGGRYVVCRYTLPAASILDIRDGAVLRSTWSSGWLPPSPVRGWSNPQLVDDGSVMLEARDGSLQISIVETATGKWHMTLCPLPEDQWIIYTPDGYWEGSQNVREWVRFYRGPFLLAPKQAERFRKPLEIRRVLRRLLGAR